MPVCSSCGSEVADGVKFCAKCGQPTGAAASGGGEAAGAGASAQPPPTTASSAGQDDNIMGALAYLAIPAIIFLIVEPYKNNRFIRFHSFQSLFLLAASFTLQIVLGVLSAMLSVIGIGFLIAILWPFVSLAIFALWVFVIVKAFQGKEYRLPVLGDLAAKQV